MAEDPATLDAFTAAEFANRKGQKAAELELHLRQRDAARRNDPLPAGGLFDQVRRVTQELF